MGRLAPRPPPRGGLEGLAPSAASLHLASPLDTIPVDRPRARATEPDPIESEGSEAPMEPLRRSTDVLAAATGVDRSPPGPRAADELAGRRPLDPSPAPRLSHYLVTVRGFGYKLNNQGES